MSSLDLPWVYVLENHCTVCARINGNLLRFMQINAIVLCADIAKRWLGFCDCQYASALIANTYLTADGVAGTCDAKVYEQIAPRQPASLAIGDGEVGDC